MTFKQRLVPGGINEINTNHVIITTKKKSNNYNERESLTPKSPIILNFKQMCKYQKNHSLPVILGVKKKMGGIK